MTASVPRQMATRAVCVAGDLVADDAIIVVPDARPAYAEQRPGAHVGRVAGGAWALAQQVVVACGDLSEAQVSGPTVALDPNTPDGAQSHGSQALAIWTPHPRGAGRRERVWRIERRYGPWPTARPVLPPSAQRDVDPCDLLVLEDANLGFRHDRRAWPAVLQGADADLDVVLRMGSPLGHGALWDHLVEHYADRLTVVVSVSALRERQAAIAQSLSWDRAIEDLDSELTRGISATDLARGRRVVVYFRGGGVAIYTRPHGQPMQLDRFVYDPEELEGSWQRRRPGRVPGDTAILAAAIARHVLDPASYPIFIAAGRALAAMRANHERGGGEVVGRTMAVLLASFQPQQTVATIGQLLHPAVDTPAAAPPESPYRAAFPHTLLRAPRPATAAPLHSNLLQDVTGQGYEYVAVTAMQVVIRGVDRALESAPKARYGAYVTVDREEIERINEISRLIMSYQANESDRRPLSLAVFGPPGAGKSFAIKQLAAQLFGTSQVILEFNLSQLASRDELRPAFDQVRDATIRGKTPLVFWDEFDTGSLIWLKEFLAPMQDAEFRADGMAHPFGKAIFVFAGGTASTFEEFDGLATRVDTCEAFRLAKGPDFDSRLRGYANIKGPNPMGARLVDQVTDAPGEDVPHLIRRAVALRSVLERFHPQLFDTEGNAAISGGVIRGFLRVRSFHHGARSLEAVVGMSALAGAPYFGVAELPSASLLSLHVSFDFMDRVREGELEEATTEHLAAASHEAWRRERENAGWCYGPARSDAERAHPLLMPYDQLSEEDREWSRHSARETLAKLLELGYRVVPASAVTDESPVSVLGPRERDQLAAIEHDAWLRHRLLHGYASAVHASEHLRLHPDVVHFDQLSAHSKQLATAITTQLIAALEHDGYALVRRSPQIVDAGTAPPPTGQT